MAGITRSTRTVGAGILGINTAIVYANGGIDLETEKRLMDVRNDITGKTDSRWIDSMFRIRATPAGQLKDLTTLFPYQTPNIGASIFGAADVASFIHSKAGKKLTFHASAVSKMPSLFLGVDKTLFGGLEVACVRKDNSEPGDANAFYTSSSLAFTDSSYTTASVKTQLFGAAWGDVLPTIRAKDGWTIDTTVEVDYHVVNGYGTIDGFLKDVGILAKCRPDNLSESLLDELQVQGASAVMGGTVRRGKTLVISSSGLTVTIYDAAITTTPMKWGTTELRAGEVGFIGHRVENAGAFGGLFLLAAA